MPRTPASTPGRIWPRVGGRRRPGRGPDVSGQLLVIVIEVEGARRGPESLGHRDPEWSEVGTDHVKRCTRPDARPFEGTTHDWRHRGRRGPGQRREGQRAAKPLPPPGIGDEFGQPGPVLVGRPTWTSVTRSSRAGDRARRPSGRRDDGHHHLEGLPGGVDELSGSHGQSIARRRRFDWGEHGLDAHGQTLLEGASRLRSRFTVLPPLARVRASVRWPADRGEETP